MSAIDTIADRFLGSIASATAALTTEQQRAVASAQEMIFRSEIARAAVVLFRG